MPFALEPLWGLAPALLALGFNFFRQFHLTNQDLRNRVRMAEATCTENLAAKIASALNHSRKLEADAELRGDGHETPDLIKLLSEGSVSMCRKIVLLDRIKAWSKRSFWGLVLISLAGIVLMVSGYVFPSLKDKVFNVAIVLFLLQVGLIVIQILISSQIENLDDYE